MRKRIEYYRPAYSGIIEELPWLSDFDFGEIKNMPTSLMREYPPEFTIISQGQQGSYIYYIDKGRVRIDVLDWQGASLTLAIATEGSIFGDLWALEDTSSPVTVTSITPVVTYMVHRDVFLQNSDLLRKLMGFLIRQNRLLLSKVKQLVFTDAYTRFVACLNHLGKKYGVPKEYGILVPVRFTHQEMASLLGVSRVTVTNIVGQLRTQGIIDYRQGFVVILDSEKLQTLAQH